MIRLEIKITAIWYKSAKISALTSGKISKCKYNSGTSQLIQQAKFTDTPSRKAFEKQTDEQVDAWICSLEAFLIKLSWIKLRVYFHKPQFNDLIFDKQK